MFLIDIDTVYGNKIRIATDDMENEQIQEILNQNWAKQAIIRFDDVIPSEYKIYTKEKKNEKIR